MTLRAVADYRHLLLSGTPLLDVRAPVEFAEGAFPAAHNHPLLDDAQRALIGTCYKADGQDAAIALGYRLATPEIKAARLAAWTDFAKRHPEAVLYCFRGGLRSRITQQWLAEAGFPMARVDGGYKALRRFLLEALERLCHEGRLIRVSGRTGTGKTALLHRLPLSLDLEGLAHHRGSTFGHTVGPQPPQIGFENALTVEWLRCEAAAPGRLVFIEDESRLIGRLALPLPLQAALKRSPVIVLETSVEAREQRVLEDYVIHQRAHFAAHFGDEARARFAAFVLGNLDRIRRRLGDVRHRALHAAWSEALETLETTGSADGFRPGIRQLLGEYYDPMYDYQHGRGQPQVLMRGDAETLAAWAHRVHATL